VRAAPRSPQSGRSPAVGLVRRSGWPTLGRSRRPPRGRRPHPSARLGAPGGHARQPGWPPTHRGLPRRPPVRPGTAPAAPAPAAGRQPMLAAARSESRSHPQFDGGHQKRPPVYGAVGGDINDGRRGQDSAAHDACGCCLTRSPSRTRRAWASASGSTSPAAARQRASHCSRTIRASRRLRHAGRPGAFGGGLQLRSDAGIQAHSDPFLLATQTMSLQRSYATENLARNRTAHTGRAMKPCTSVGHPPSADSFGRPGTSQHPTSTDLLSSDPLTRAWISSVS
jgi:hypothetical protein